MTQVAFQCPKCRLSFSIDEERLPLSCCGQFYRTLAELPRSHPSLARKVLNFTRDTGKQARTGRLVDDATRDMRLGQCEACILHFDKTRETCSHVDCGCGMRKQRGVIDALSWQGKQCPIGRWHRPPFLTHASLTADAMRLLGMMPPDIAGVVAVPRSGLLPAGVIATAAHLPLWVLNEAGLSPAGGGYRTRALHELNGPVLVVDDSSMYGGQMGRTQAHWAKYGGGRPAIFAAVYCAPAKHHKYGPMPDIYARELDDPHIFEWNFFNNGYIKQTAYDFDGIFTIDQTEQPQYLPRLWPVPLIVTGRLERGRERTAAWLAKHRIEYKELIMYQGTEEERDQPGELGRYKAEHFAASGLKYFAESDPVQASQIAGRTGKMVVCPAIARVF